jgi:hypothetical protein
VARYDHRFVRLSERMFLTGSRLRGHVSGVSADEQDPL